MFFEALNKNLLEFSASRCKLCRGKEQADHFQYRHGDSLVSLIPFWELAIISLSSSKMAEPVVSLLQYRENSFDRSL